MSTVVSLIIKEKGDKRISKRSMDIFLGACLACLSRTLLLLNFFSFFFPIPISLPRLLLTLLSAASSSPLPSYLVFLLFYRSVSRFSSRKSTVFRPHNGPSARRHPVRGVEKPTKLRNRVTQCRPLPRGKHTTRAHVRNITQAI